MAARSARRRIRRSFTLVEMLVVVVIIGILAGLITGAAMIAQRAARKAALKTELADIEAALAAYKEKLGDYPPDGTDPNLVRAHLLKAFPNSKNTAVPTMDPSTALVFWLGGYFDTTTGTFTGFSANPRDPFQTSSVTPSRIGPFYEFKKEQLVAAGSSTFPLYRYLPNNGNATSEPIVYFRARANGAYPTTPAPGTTGCKACLDTRTGTTAFADAKKYQLRSPGTDGKHGTGIQFPTGTDYNADQYDDVVSFTEKSLGDAIP
jgi:prepilin-type N-terminal cleavage/methylation domain-containing protein